MIDYYRWSSTPGSFISRNSLNFLFVSIWQKDADSDDFYFFSTYTLSHTYTHTHYLSLSLSTVLSSSTVLPSLSLIQTIFIPFSLSLSQSFRFFSLTQSHTQRLILRNEKMKTFNDVIDIYLHRTILSAFRWYMTH